MTVILQIKIMLYVDNKVVLTTLIHFLQLQIVKALAWIHFFLCTPMGLRGPAGIIPMSHPWGCVAPNVLTATITTMQLPGRAYAAVAPGELNYFTTTLRLPINTTWLNEFQVKYVPDTMSEMIYHFLAHAQCHFHDVAIFAFSSQICILI